jgi:hypothetical protein
MRMLVAVIIVSWKRMWLAVLVLGSEKNAKDVYL